MTWIRSDSENYSNSQAHLLPPVLINIDYQGESKRKHDQQCTLFILLLITKDGGEAEEAYSQAKSKY